MNLKTLCTKLKEENLTLVSSLQDDIYTSTQRGIAPILDPMKENIDFFKDAIVVDKVIGKATAMLLIMSHVKFIYAYVLSQEAKDILDKYHIDYQYDTLVEYIENRDQSGMCPMEKTVFDIDDLQTAYQLLIKKQEELRKKK